MKIALIGGTSYIGLKLIPYLLKNNIKVIATYNSNKVYRAKNIVWKKLDIKKNKNNYYKYLEKPDIVLNLACPDIPKYKLKKHFKTYYYQKKICCNLVNNGLKNLIGMGTCYEYGKINGKITENTNEKPIIPYAIAKLKLLKSLLKLKKSNTYKFTWLRPFFVFGDNKKRLTLYTLLKKLEKNQISKIKVCGSLVRDFVPIDFLCAAIIKIILLNQDFGVINLSTGKGITIKKFIKNNIIYEKNKKKIDMNGNNPNDFEPKFFWGDNNKLKKILKKKFISLYK